MLAYRIHMMVIVANICRRGVCILSRGNRRRLPDAIEALPYLIEVCCDDGTVKSVKSVSTRRLDSRQSWLTVGLPCELHGPFHRHPAMTPHVEPHIGTWMVTSKTG